MLQRSDGGIFFEHELVTVCKNFKRAAVRDNIDTDLGHLDKVKVIWYSKVVGEYQHGKISADKSATTLRIIKVL